MLKREIRRQVQSKLREVSKQRVSVQSQAVCDHLRSLFESEDFPATHRSVACYLSIPGEIQTDEIVALLFGLNRKVFVPRCTDVGKSGQLIPGQNESTSHRHLTFHRLMHFQESLTLPKGQFGIREPPLSVPATLPPLLDVILVPGVAFDLNGGRIGHGAGYYDDFAQRYRHYNGQEALWLGLALEEQIIDSVPMDEHDRRLDGLVTPKGVVWIKK